jgi:hypothetical protein
MTFIDLANATRTLLLGMPRLDIPKWITRFSDLSLLYRCFELAARKWGGTEFFVYNRRDILREFLAFAKPIVERGLPPTPSQCSYLMGLLTSISLLPHMQKVLRSFRRGDGVIIGGERFVFGSRSEWKAKHMLAFFRFVLSDSFSSGKYVRIQGQAHLVSSYYSSAHTGMHSVIARDQLLSIINEGGLENVSFSGDEQKAAIQSGQLTPRGRVNLPPAPAAPDCSKLYLGYSGTPLSTPRGLNIPTHLERPMCMEGVGAA